MPKSDELEELKGKLASQVADYDGSSRRVVVPILVSFIEENDLDGRTRNQLTRWFGHEYGYGF